MISRRSNDFGGSKRSCGCCRKLKECINRQMSVQRKELLAASDVTIVTKRKMSIYAYCNLICFIVQMISIYLLV